MMASPEDLEDFATGFSVSEGIIDASGAPRATSISRHDDGITIDVSLYARDLHRYLAGRRVRQLRGNTSCGLCGVEDLADIRRPATRVGPGKPLDVGLIRTTLVKLREWQPLSRQTRGAHASAWVTLEGELSAVREDVGRHNSLDKLIGCLIRGGCRPPQGFCLITSRCSFEMVQKAVAAGFPTLVSVGAPTAHAVRLATRRRSDALLAIARRRADVVHVPRDFGVGSMARTRKLGPDLEVKPFTDAAGGWGSVKSLVKSLGRDHVPFSGSRVLLKQNKPDGFMCVSCAWAKPADPRVFEFCENGAKATTWEITSKRVTPEFFADKTSVGPREMG